MIIYRNFTDFYLLKLAEMYIVGPYICAPNLHSENAPCITFFFMFFLQLLEFYITDVL